MDWVERLGTAGLEVLAEGKRLLKRTVKHRGQYHA